MGGNWQQILLCTAALCLLRPAHAEDLPYKNPALPFEQRVADLVSRLSIQEKADQMQIAIPANAQWGIPAMRWGMEGLHGISGSTIYPDAMAMGASFDPDLIKKIASAIGDDARARSSLILWAPVVNMVRDPRWGRNFETFGEDPFLSARLAAAYCLGMQGDDPKYLKVVAAPKHFAVYSQEAARGSVNAIVSQRALREYYLPAFEACFVEGHAAGTMAAYNAINGIPCSAHEWLLTTVLREEWHFSGGVSTDSRAVNQIFSSHHYADSEESAVAAAVNAGVDVIYDTGAPVGGVRVTQLIVTANDRGMFKRGAVDRAVTSSLLVRFRLGLFDPPAANPYSQLRTSSEITKTHVDLALQAARESITLLQNNPPPRGTGFGPLLPIDLRRISSIAVLGPTASISLYGSYAQGQAIAPTAGSSPAPRPGASRGPSPLEALQAAIGDRVALRNAQPSDSDTQILDLARRCDLVLFFGGNDTRIDRAGTDRRTLDLPLDQIQLLDKLVKVNPNLILILTGGSAINLEDLKTKCPAILMQWYNGEQGGNALAEVLLGITSPAGRLPITFYKSLNDIPQMEDYEVLTGRTYLYCQKPVTFPFGHGLSYTTFAYDNFKVAPPLNAAPIGPGGSPENPGNITVSLDITNTGTRPGDEVVQIYARQLSPKVIRPLKQLVALARVPLAKGEKKSLTLSVPLKSLAYWDEADHQWTLDPGPYEYLAAASSSDIRQRATVDLK